MITMPSANDPNIDALRLTQSQQEDPRTELGQEAFLELMITQIRNQDPFEPMENGEFIGQLAQFSTVSGIGDMSQSLEKLADSLYAGQALQAATVVGRDVLADGEVARLSADKPLLAGIELPAPSGSAFARIFDQAGQLVAEVPLGPLGSGLSTFEWDGTLEDGSTAAPGLYRVTGGTRNGDEEAALPTYVGMKVASVSLAPDGSGTQITADNGEKIRFSQIKSIM